MMSNKTNTAVLGAWTFFVSAHAIDVCGINGLPLTPNSIHVLGTISEIKIIATSWNLYILGCKRGKHGKYHLQL
ncbi:hypothetical protein CEXT_82781 [Caerostris extrusa]|uniref:Secreted protein n=1 Tax=Caerostris extrusa TaxID=172846 RepID=A0AAV4QV34_CAEEX|nr:hypothetical protein CEXT_82781 [Caerostris extrusa]